MDRGLPFSDSGTLAARVPQTRVDVSALTLFAALLAIFTIYLPTIASLTAIWNRSETFAHGWLVTPIVLWLVWQRRHVIAPVQWKPSYLGLAAIALAGFGWLLAELASVASVAQYAFVLMIPATVVTVMGPAARQLAFPLAFLLFAVPAGEFLVPTLMDWTATFTTAALRLSGIPVYREGNHFILPTGAWSVVEACSGIRYLAASLMTGMLYAYLCYRSLGRRLAFAGAAIAVPLVANWIRAYLIVIVGHVSGGRVAAGVDHLIYGWIFFGIVVALMFWIGSFWREDMEDTATGQQPLLSVTPAASSRGPVIVAAALAVATAAVWPAAANRLESANEAPVLLKPLVGSGGWRTTEEQLAVWSPRFSGARAMVHQALEKEGVGRVAVYVAYYRDQAVYGELVNSENVLVTTTDKNWREIRKDVQGLSWGSALVQARTSELIGEGRRLLVHRFYWIGGRLTASDYVAKAWLAFTKLAAVGDASAAIVVYTIAAEGQEKQAAVRLDRFAAEVGEEVNRTLLQASGTN